MSRRSLFIFAPTIRLRELISLGVRFSVLRRRGRGILVVAGPETKGRPDKGAEGAVLLRGFRIGATANGASRIL
jgi:hypothetical protein